MANIIIKKNLYRDTDAVYDVLRYVLASPYLRYAGAYGLLYYPALCNLAENERDSNIESMAGAFKAVKALYYKTDGSQLKHIVVAFHPKEMHSSGLAWVYAERIAAYIGSRFQVVYGVHQGSEEHRWYWHIHLVVNTVSYMDGKRFYNKWDKNWNLVRFARKMDPKLRWNIYLD